MIVIQTIRFFLIFKVPILVPRLQLQLILVSTTLPTVRALASSIAQTYTKFREVTLGTTVENIAAGAMSVRSLLSTLLQTSRFYFKG